MADLSSLMRVAPITGAGMVGRQAGQEFQTEALNQDKLRQLIVGMQQEQQQSGQMNPLMLQQQQLKNQTMQTELPGILEKIRKQKLENDSSSATQQSDIDTTLALNDQKQVDVKNKKASQLRKALLDSVGEMSVLPAAARPAALRNILKNAGLDPSSPGAAAIMQKFDSNPDAIPQMMQQIAEKMGQVEMATDTKSLASIKGHEIAAKASNYSADKHAGATLGAARIAADSRLEIAKTKASNGAKDVLQQLKDGKLNYEQAATKLEVYSEFEEDPEKKMQYQQLARRLAQENMNARRNPQMQVPGIQSQTPQTGLGQGAGPKQGTSENPIVLR